MVAGKVAPMIRALWRSWLLWLAALALLAACGGPTAPASLAEVVPLDTGRPTFLFFFTDP